MKRIERKRKLSNSKTDGENVNDEVTKNSEVLEIVSDDVATIVEKSATKSDIIQRKTNKRYLYIVYTFAQPHNRTDTM
jgi:hypothetical protein